SLVNVLCYGAVQSFSISSTQPFYGCSALKYFYYGGSESYFNTTPMQSNSYTYSDLNDGASTFTMIYNFDHMEFTYHNGYYSFKSKGTPSDSDIIAIPSTYDDGVHGRYNVTVIEENAFKNQTGTFSVNLPSTITTIGDYAFYNCPYMSAVNLPSNLTSIGDYAFYNCVYTNASFTIPKNVEYIGPYTFYYCTYLGLQFASNSKLRYIGERAFYNVGYYIATEDRYKVAIPDGVTYIGDSAFYNSPYLFKDDLKLPSGLLYLGRYSFGFCQYITRVELPRTLDSLNELAFYYCTGLRVVYIPSTLKSISARTYSVSPFYYAGANSTTAPNISIYVEGEGIPSGWGEYWNYVYSGKKANTFFNYPKMPNAYLSNLSTSYPMVQDGEGIFRLDLTSKVSSSTSLGLRIDANYFVNVRFEYMIYGTSASNDMCVEMNGAEYPVSLLGNQTTTYQYYSRLMAPGEYMKIMFSNANGSASAGMYIKNLRIEPIEQFGDYAFQYSKSGALTTLKSTNQSQDSGAYVTYLSVYHYSASGFTYYATEHCELSLGYRSNGESSHDYIRGVLNDTTEVFSAKGAPSSSTFKTYSLIMKPGDKITIYYRKDGSVNNGDDTGYIRNFYVAKISEYAIIGRCE
ncbi:MAG: leucine-rich repeat domain-containing protein, partial [Clostridia bacterium]|nr:leucine-rich repeat domain-containing protein [Clostridia bacterium]